jgi:hypothetical protein
MQVIAVLLCVKDHSGARAPVTGNDKHGIPHFPGRFSLASPDLIE